MAWQCLLLAGNFPGAVPFFVGGLGICYSFVATASILFQTVSWSKIIGKHMHLITAAADTAGNADSQPRSALRDAIVPCGNQAEMSASAGAICFHSQLAPVWNSKYLKRSFRARQAVVVSALEPLVAAGSKWLDAGCGTGTFARWLAERGCKVVAVDGSAEMIHAARENTCFDVIRFEVALIEDIRSIPDASCDGILCSSVLEYVEDVGRCLNEFSRILRPGGVIVCTVPNAESLFRQSLVAVRAITRKMGGSLLKYLDYSRQEFTPADFIGCLNRHEFKFVSHKVFGGLLPRPLSQIRRIGALLIFVATRQ